MRYIALAYLSQWRDRTRERHALREITASRRDDRDHSVRGVNFLREDDLQFLRTRQRGEPQIQGVRNRTLQPHLPGWKPSRMGRPLRRFRVLQLLKSVAGAQINFWQGRWGGREGRGRPSDRCAGRFPNTAALHRPSGSRTGPCL